MKKNKYQSTMAGPETNSLHEESATTSDMGVADMTQLSEMDETGVNRNLKIRYVQDRIYTYTGTILVAVNPYKALDIYTPEHVESYHGSKMGALEPHVFALAEAAHASLRRTERNQSCVISGESGAGKTESTKFILQYLCSVTSNVSTWVEQQILEANTILEAFGNAKTVRNDNSSRFGKFMQICFDSRWLIKGCIIQDYLLEQSRITFQSSAERNYHVFYQLVEAAKSNQELSALLHFTPNTEFQYLNQGGCLKIEGVSDAARFDSLRLAFNVLHVPPEMCDGLLKVLSAILWLGNVQFEDVDGERCQLALKDKQVLKTVAELLGLQLDDVIQVALLRQINVRGNITEIPLKLQEAKENRHAMSKALYSRAFAWLVNHINLCTNPGQDATRFLGVLDIFGFENFASNSFEQLCINYTNEKLHKFFNHYVFALEQEIYRQEGIEFAHIQFTDNTSCLELLEKPPRCVLKLLSEQCHMPKGSDLAYLTNLHGEFEGHPHFVKGEDRRKWEKEFGIRHYAGCVTYCVTGFVDKNRDMQQDVLFDFMSRAENAFVCELTKYQDLLGCTAARMNGASPAPGATMARGTSKGKPTVSDAFRHQLQSLVDVLQATTPWYVRCIKPNMRKVPNDYNEPLVLDQLKYLGMIDIIRIRKEGFPVHMDISEFNSRYSCLVTSRSPPDSHEAARRLLTSRNSPTGQWQLGKTKVFLRSVVYEPLEDARSNVLNSMAVRIQSNWRGFRLRREYRRRRHAVLALQAAYRGWKQRIRFIQQRRAAIIIQARLRGVFAREVAAALREMRRVEEAMRRRERQEAERQAAAEAEAAAQAETLEQTEREAQQEIAALNQKLAAAAATTTQNNAEAPDAVDLDNLFAFLSDATPRNKIIDEIGDRMDELVGDLDEELEAVMQKECEGHLPRPTGLGAPTLPEPTEPPPPPPPPIGQASAEPETPVTVASDTETTSGTVGEPIYESVLPRDEIATTAPSPTEEEEADGSPPPLPAPPHKLLIPAVVPQAGGSPRQSRPNSRASNQGANAWRDDPEREQRRKFRVEKKLMELEAPIEEPDIYHDMVEFAQDYFNNHERLPEGTIMATLTRRSSRGGGGEVLPKYEMLTYHRGSSIPTSHVHMYDPDNVAAACSVFRELCKYSRGELKSGTNETAEATAIQTIVGYGIEREELRDEILVQCVRQATNNPSPEATERIWLLLCLCLIAFPPSKLLHKYFVSWLRKSLQLEGRLRQYVQWCLDTCRHPRAVCRRRPPSTVEIAAMRRLGTIVCRFFFLDGRTKAIDVHPTDTAAAAAAKLADKLALRNLDGWAIYQAGPDGEQHVRGHDYLYDVIADWERAAGGSASASSSATLGGGENRFVFKRRLFRASRELSQDPVEVGLLYAQAVYNVVKCDDFPVSEKVALQLAGLQAQVALGSPKDSNRLDYYSDVEAYLPYRVSRSRGDDVWAPILAQAHRQYGAGKTELSSKLLYLSCVMQYPLYGTTMFAVTYRGYWPYGNSLILGVSCIGLSLLRAEDKFVLAEYRYQDIESIFLDPSDSFITVNLARAQTDSAQRCFVFETVHKTEIGSLVVSYWPALASWISPELEPPPGSAARRAAITNEERRRLYHTLVSSRRALIDAEMLRKPPDLGAAGFLRNTLRRLSKRRIEKLRQEHGSGGGVSINNPFSDGGETYKGFPHAFWAFSRQALTASLSRLPEADEQQSLAVFNTILAYAGLGQNGDTVRRAEDEHISLMQTILERCMRRDPLLNELYLQLMKQTTDHPDPNSRVNLRHWALLALACSVVLPPGRPIRRLLASHLKRCAADFVTEEGKYARFAEKCMHKTQGTRRRQWPPSREEILCTVNRRPIYARFHLMDGQYHAVEFHASATAREVLAAIQTKIGLRENAQGYAIYEVLGPSERSLLPDEKLADVMSKWERYRTANAAAAAAAAVAAQAGNITGQPSRHHHLFLFKKHLFLDEYMNIDDPVEKELLYHQVLHGLRADRFPVSDMEAVMLTALQAQLELGDCPPEGAQSLDYRPVASHCLPPRLVPCVRHDSVAQHHQSQRGLSSWEAKQLFLNLVESWPLHRSTIFDVMQSFTSNWPRVLWLAVDQKGLHLLEHRSRHALCTYEYTSLASLSPALNCLMIITREGMDQNLKQSKVILTTSQAFQIANLIREYTEVLQLQNQVSPTTSTATSPPPQLAALEAARRREMKRRAAPNPPDPPHHRPPPPPHAAPALA